MGSSGKLRVRSHLREDLCDRVGYAACVLRLWSPRSFFMLSNKLAFAALAVACIAAAAGGGDLASRQNTVPTPAAAQTQPAAAAAPTSPPAAASPRPVQGTEAVGGDRTPPPTTQPTENPAATTQ